MRKQLYFHTHKHISMYIYKHVKYLKFLGMEFSSLSVIGNPEIPFSSFSLFCSPKFPFCASTTITHLPTFSPLLLPHMYHMFSTQQLFNRQLPLVVLCAVRGAGERYWRNLQWIPMFQPGNKNLDSKYKAKAWLKPQERLGFVVGLQPNSKLLRSWLL